jgi:hypothetical protein
LLEGAVSFYLKVNIIFTILGARKISPSKTTFMENPQHFENETETAVIKNIVVISLHSEAFDEAMSFSSRDNKQEQISGNGTVSKWMVNWLSKVRKQGPHNHHLNFHCRCYNR